MSDVLPTLPGVALMLGLGLRHGFDPDHIALIDSLALQAHRRRPRIAPWVGTWFALGHGMVVTVIAVIVSLTAQRVTLPAAVAPFIEWVPVALLLLIGIANLRALCANQAQSASVVLRLGIVPAALRSTTHPLGIFIVGALFAAIFDTITQAAAWGYIATQQGGVVSALLSGGIFTLGMLITDTLDSRLLCRVLRNASPHITARYRRRLAWLVVCMSFAVVLYALLSALFPRLVLSDLAYSALGLTMMGVVAGFYLWLWWLGRPNVAHARP